MMAFAGADTGELRRLAIQMDAATRSLEDAARMLTSTINSHATWRGHDADRFRSQWNSSDKARLSAVGAALRDGANTLRRNADEQDRASAPAGGSGAGLGSSPKNTAGLFTSIKKHADDSHDGIRIQQVMGADGKERFIVYLDGTDSAPGRYTREENVLAVQGMSTPTRDEIIRQMKERGIDAHSEVMMVGYSQGGLYAQSIADSGQFGSPVVVTFGSPATGHVIPTGLNTPPVLVADVPRSGVDVVRLEANNDEIVHFVNPFAGSHGVHEGVRDLFGAGGNDTTFASGSHQLPESDGEALRTGNFGGLFGAHTDPTTYTDVADSFDASTDPQYEHVRERMSHFMDSTVTWDSDAGAK